MKYIFLLSISLCIIFIISCTNESIELQCLNGGEMGEGKCNCPIEYEGEYCDSIKTDFQFELKVNPVGKGENTALVLDAPYSVEIRIMDMTGKIVFQLESSNQSLITIPTTNFKSGVYLIDIQNMNLNIKKLIKLVVI